MSQKYSGGFITKSPVAPTSSAASGIWTLDQQQQAQQAGTWPSPPVFIEDFFSTYLYTGNGSTQTITNNIDLSGQGGLVWIKSRTAYNHNLFDTTRGVNNRLFSNTTAAQTTTADSLTAFNTNGFSLGGIGGINDSSDSLVSWTFRKQPKFFDVVTWSGNATYGRTIPHNLGSTPGCIIVKCTSTGATNWCVYHRGLTTPTDQGLYLNATDAAGDVAFWAYTAPTSTVFSLSASDQVNGTGDTYVAYLFAHDAGGFPVSGGGSTNGISCGSFTTDGSGLATVSLGYEPQWVMVKSTSAAGNWFMFDIMRGYTADTTSGTDARLYANTSGAEVNTTAYGGPNATGFTGYIAASTTYIYIAIRRGPMKPPTVGTSVFTPIAWTATDAPATVSGFNFPVDLTWHGQRAGVYGSSNVTSWDRLRGAKAELYTGLTDAEGTRNGVTGFDYMSAVQVSNPTTVGEVNYPASNTEIFWGFRRAPGFFDEVCYTGNNAYNRAITHNLAAVPELVITKIRSDISAWAVYVSATGLGYPMALNTTAAAGANPYVWGTTAPTSTNFYIGDDTRTNGGGFTYVSYLFATCAGVSKVGSYTGTGALQTVNCGFTSGARFVLIKRSDSTGAWYVWDSARGITAGNDPYLLLNSTAAEVTGTNYVDTDTTGFQVTAAAPAALNDSGGTFIFLAIA